MYRQCIGARIIYDSDPAPFVYPDSRPSCAPLPTPPIPHFVDSQYSVLTTDELELGLDDDPDSDPMTPV